MTHRLLSMLRQQPLALLALFVALGGTSYAATKSRSTSNVINGCVDRSGGLRIVERPKCKSRETAISFNREGQPGKAGGDGVAGAAGHDGAPGPAGTAGRDGAKGAAGRDGVIGRDGVDGAAGRDGTDGDAGRDGVDGAAGRDGVDGVIGRDGVDGAAGRDGADGDAGRDGVDGAAGRDGTDGFNALTATTSEPAGANCATGGVLLQHGLDANGNTTLDGGEVTASRYVCNGAQGASVTGAAEPAGANCAAGGARYSVGADVQYVCNAPEESGTSLLGKLLGADGHGSGLDADTLDGWHASDFVRGNTFAALFSAQHTTAFDTRIATLFGTDNSTSMNGLGGECVMATIALTAANYAPPGTMFAAGQTLTIMHYPALYALLGTIYGGDGVTTFRVPDLRKQAPGGTHYTICHSGYWPSRD